MDTERAFDQWGRLVVAALSLVEVRKSTQDIGHR